jgi:hypothetical protein
MVNPTLAAADEAAAAAISWIRNVADPIAFKAGHAPNPVIVDEFPPYLWSGADAPERWLADLAKFFSKHDTGAGPNSVRFDHAAPAQAQSDGNSAYVMIPVMLRLRVGGKPLSASGQIAFVMTRTREAWKIASWTYSAPPPSPDR